MKRKRIIGAVVVVLVIAAGLWWFLQPAPVPVRVAVTAAISTIVIPEVQYPIDPKSPALHPPPQPAMVPPPAQPHAPQPPNPATLPLTANDYSISELKTTFADMARLYRSGDWVTAMQTYMPPDEWAKMRPDDIESKRRAQAEVAHDPQVRQRNEEAAQSFESLANQTPTFNASGDEATYLFTLPPSAGAPPGNSTPMAFVKINGRWYVKMPSGG